MAALGKDRRGHGHPEGGHYVAERATMVATEHDHQLGIEPLHALGGRRQRRAESAPERVLDIALLTRAVAGADHQSLRRHVLTAPQSATVIADSGQLAAPARASSASSSPTTPSPITSP